MSNSIEDEIVSMKWDNRQFAQGIGSTLSLLEKLKSHLNFGDAGKSLDGVQQSANRFNMGRMRSAVDGATHSWHVMSIVAGTVIATLTHQALIAGERIARSLFSPISQGFQNYQEQINAVQTILANTQAAGVNLKQVTDALNQLNQYANLTIYNFSEMAKNIGTFTAAGVGLQDSVNAIKGIANLAALSGSNSQQASTAMYQLSQAISAGQVHLQDWNSVVNAGMGGTVFQRALAQTAVAMGKLKDSSLKLVGPMKNVSIHGESFRQSLQVKPGEQTWLTSKVLTNTLAQFTGDLTKAQLKAQGFNDEQIKAIQAQAKTAENAATQIKTVSQLSQALKEEVASAWAGVFKVLLGNINQAKKILSPLHNTLQNMFTAPINGITKLLAGWSKLGGRNVAIMAIVQGFHDVMRVINAVKGAFRDIFPKKTAQDLYGFTTQFETLMIKLRPGKKTVEDIRRTFRGVFAVFDIGIQIVKGIVRGFQALFGSVSTGQGNFLNFTGNVGDLIVSFDEFLKKGDYIGKFFEGLGHILAVPIQLLGAVADLIAGIFSGFSNAEADKVSGTFDRMDRSLSPLQKVFEVIIGLFAGIGKAFAEVGPKIGQQLSGLDSQLAKALSNGNFSAVFDVINTVLLGGIALLIRKFFKSGFKLDLGQGGLIEAIKSPFEQLTGSLKAMQTQVKAKTLLEIAYAIGIITASVVALSLINSKDLTKALGAMTAGFVELLSSMAILTKLAINPLRIAAIAAAMDMMAASILILSIAVGVLGTMKWSTIGKGLAAIAGLLLVIGAAMRLMPKGMVLQAAALDLIAGALLVLAGAVAAFGLIPWKNMERGLVGVAGALLVIAGAMHLMPKGMVLQAVALAILSKALLLIAGAVAGLGLLSWEQIAKGLVALGGALAIIAGGLYLMSGALPGAAALIVVAGALAILTPVLATLGHMSWKTLLTGLGALAAVFVVLGVAGLLLTPVIPALLGLGASLLLVGAGMTLAGAGVVLFSTGIGIFVAACAAAVGAIGGILTVLPQFFTAFADGIINFVTEIGKHTTELVNVGNNLIIAILKGFQKVIPQVGKTVNIFIHTMLKVLRSSVPDLIGTGIYLYISLLKGIRKNIPQIVKLVGDIIVAFLNALGKALPKITDAGVRFIVKFLNGVANAIDKHEEEMLTAGANIGWAIIHGMLKALADGAHWIVDKVKGIGGDAIDAAKHVFHINSPSKDFQEIGSGVIEGMVKGLDDNAHHVNRSIDTMGKTAIETMRMSMKKVGDAVPQNLDLSPKITPVLDLTQLQKDATQIGSSMGKHGIVAHVSRHGARSISAEQAELAKHLDSGGSKKVEQNFYQTNTSPKALDAVTIFRRTKSQFAQAKEAVSP